VCAVLPVPTVRSRMRTPLISSTLSQHLCLTVKKSDLKSHERKMANVHKHVLGGAMSSGSLTPPASKPASNSKNALAGR
jgi:hypothetical protein